MWVYPVVDDRIEIEIKESDCRIDTFRSSGAGGQHVNTTDSAVRITHIPTGIVVACQQERSQHKNRATAWNMLRARLYEQELQKREDKANAEAASKTDIGWGHQIRSYVLQPYQLVKDLRTGVQSTSPSDVLDGELDPFMEAALAQRVYGGERGGRGHRLGGRALSPLAEKGDAQPDEASHCNAFAASSTSRAWPGTFTLGQTLATVPSRSRRTVVRSVPMYVLPYMLFSTQTPNASSIARPSSEARGNSSPYLARNLSWLSRLSDEMPTTAVSAAANSALSAWNSWASRVQPLVSSFG